MNEHRKRILQLLAEGRITPEEAERLIAAIGNDGTPPPAARGNARYLRVVVEADEAYPHGGPSKVNIRVPMQLLRAGVRLASLIPVQAREEVNGALRQQGLNIDLAQIKPENLEELVDQLDDLTVDVDKDRGKTRVRVFCE